MAFSVPGACELLGCHPEAAGAPDYQGIVEYEERVLPFELAGPSTSAAIQRVAWVAAGGGGASGVVA